MKLIASMNTRNELSRYLSDSIPSLLRFVDEVRVQDDGSDDGTYEYLAQMDGVVVKRNTGSRWHENEGELHQQLLDFTLEGRPTHVLAIDADEFVPDGQLVRAAIEDNPRRTAFSLRMVEIWKLDPPTLRLDGGWRPHQVGICYRWPDGHAASGDWAIWGRKMAGGRVPRAVRALQSRGACVDTGADILHLGWSNPAERERRYRRYAELDGGRYHAARHLRSILLPDEKIALAGYDGSMPETTHRDLGRDHGAPVPADVG